MTGRLLRAVRVQHRLFTFAVARLRHRRLLALLTVGGTAVTVAMLTLTLVLQTGVEDRTFTDALRGAGEPAIYIDTPIASDAVSLRRKLTDEIARDGFAVRSRAVVVAPGGSFMLLDDDVASDFALQGGRLPRPCTRDHCEWVRVYGVGSEGFYGGVATGPLDVPGVRTAEVGRVHQKRSVLPPGFFPDRVAVISGFALLRDRSLTIGRGGLLWSAPLSTIVKHPWDVDRAILRTTRLRSDLARSTSQAHIDAQFDQLRAAKDEATAAGRRLLVVSGAMIGVFLAFLIFVATRLRADADLLRERLLLANASRSQIRFLTLFEYAVATAAGAVFGIAIGEIAGAALASHVGAAGIDSSLHVLGSGRSWLYWTAAAAGSLAVFLLIAWLNNRGVKGRPLPLAEIAAVVAGAALVAGFLSGGLDANRLAHADAGVIGFVTLAPVLAVAVVAVIGARLFRPGLRAVGRATERLGTSTRLAALSVARRPGDAAVLVAFVGATLGLALFLDAYRATLSRSQHDQALYAAPMDFLVSEDLRSLIPVNSVPFERYPGSPKVRVMRSTGEIPQLAGGGFTLMGIPADKLARIDGWRSNFAAEGLHALSRRLRPTSDVAFRAVRLPSRGVLTFPIRTAGEPLDVTATLVSANGNFQDVPIGDTHSHVLRLVVPAGFRNGSLAGFSFQPGDTGLHEQQNAGELVDDVAVGSLRLGPVDWADFRQFRGVNGLDVRPSLHSVRIRYAVGTEATARLRMRQPTDGHFVNIAVSPELARAAGNRGVLPLDVLGTEVAARVVAVVRHFPTVHGNVVLADQQWIATALNANDPGPPFYNEVWIDARRPEHVAEALAAPPFRGMSVVNRSDVSETSQSATMVRGARDLFLVGSLAAIGLAILGLALAAASDVQARRWEILDLRGQGAEREWVGRFIRRRLVISCGFAAVVAGAAGALLLYGTVSLLRIAADFRQPDPPVRMVVPWLGIAVVALVIAAAGTLLVTTLVRSQVREIGQSRT